MVSFEFLKIFKVFLGIIVYMYTVGQGEWRSEGDSMELVSPPTAHGLQGSKLALHACPTTTLSDECSLQQLSVY